MNTQVPNENTHFSLMYTTHHKFTVLSVKHLVNQEGEPLRHKKLASGKKPSLSNLHVFFFLCGAGKATTNVDTNMLNMHHQPQWGFLVIFIGTTQHQKGYLIYAPSTQKIFFSHHVVFEKKSYALEYTLHLYSEAFATRHEVSYIPFATTSHEQTGGIITFTQFEEEKSGKRM